MIPFIGISNFACTQEVEEVLSTIPHDCRRQLLISTEADNGIAPADIFSQDPRARNMLRIGVTDDRTFVQDLMRFSVINGDQLHGFFIKPPLPRQTTLEEYRRWFPEHKMIMHITLDQMRQNAYPPTVRAAQIKRYRNLIDMVLLDLREGDGRNLPPDDVYLFLQALMAAIPDMDMAIAEELNDATFYFIKDLLRNFLGLSIDLRGLAREPDGRLNVATAKKNIQSILELCGFRKP